MLASSIKSLSGARTNTGGQTAFALFSAIKRDGVVTFSVRIAATGTGSNVTAFTGMLPDGFQPYAHVTGFFSYNTASQSIWFLTVYPTGRVDLVRYAFTDAGGMVASNLSGTEDYAHTLIYMAR